MIRRDRHPREHRVVLVLKGRGIPAGLIELRPRFPMRMQAWLRSTSLDEQLASGRSPDDHPLRAVRARWLVRQSVRTKLARDWEDLIERAMLRPTLLASNLPLCRRRILESAHEIQLLAASLRTPLPVPAQGVAMAAALLADGSGPIYQRRSREDLRTRLCQIRGRLDPATRLLEEAAA